MALDNCSQPHVNFTEALTLGDCEGDYRLTRTWTADDDCGNEDSRIQTITVFDESPPVLVGVPSDATVECDALPAPAIVTASDNCSDPLVRLDESMNPGPCEGALEVIRTWTATDACGNLTIRGQIITLIDRTPPILIGMPVDATVQCDAIPVPAVVTATDNCSDPVVELTEDTQAGPGDGKGIIRRTWTATDDCGNRVAQTQTLLVIDSTAPTLAGVPSNLTVECDAVPPMPTVTATDNCAIPSVAWTERVEEGRCDGAMTITRTWTATDDCGNQTTQTQTITVVDTTAPTFQEVPPDATAECDSVPPPADLTASDNCSAAMVEFREVSEPGDCVGESTLTRTWTATDDCGNHAEHVQVIHIADTTNPVFRNEPPDFTAECDSVPRAITLSATDNCDATIPVKVTEQSTPGDCAGDYELSRTWRAVDDCGNEASVDQSVTVRDTTAPTIRMTPNGTQFICDGQPVTYSVESRDNCGDASLSLTDLVTITANNRDLVTVIPLANGGVQIIAAGPAMIMGSFAATDECVNISVPFEFTVFARLGREACSQGFWRNHPERWGSTGFTPEMRFVDAFQITDLSSPEIPSSFDANWTLLTAANQTGGSFNQALLQGTAALLNAVHPAIEFPATVEQIRSAMQDAFAGLITFDKARTMFVQNNAVESECGCPVQ
jgi:hypothetical protein